MLNSAQTFLWINQVWVFRISMLYSFFANVQLMREILTILKNQILHSFYIFVKTAFIAKKKRIVNSYTSSQNLQLGYRNGILEMCNAGNKQRKKINNK